ncbi:MAG: hypothetical protein O2865_04075 [Planctomycetota bacterium]|nr:hypothetical protein [Planctomycetota bacterium]MDA0932287.1 hypothetical protein [Planctomycetota bacterium]
MTDDQKPFDDDLTFDDVPVVPEDPRAQVDGDDFLDEVDEAEQAGDFLTEPPEEGPTFAVHHRGAELFPAQAAQDVDQEGEDVSGEEPSAELELDAEPADPETGPTDELGFDSGIDADDELEGSAVDQSADDFLAEGEGDSVEVPATEPAAEDEATFDDVFDDMFVIEFDGADAEDQIVEEPVTPLSAVVGEPAADEDEPLGELLRAPAFDAQGSSTEFREDRAGWLGEDLPLAEFVGERNDSDPAPVDLFEEDGAADEDPFAIDEVELEVEGARDEDEADEPVVLDADVLQGDAEDDDAWAPLGAGESWVMGSDLGADEDGESGADADVVTEDSESEDLAPVFGMGRFDPTLAQDEEESAETFAESFDVDEDEADYSDPIYGDVGAGIDEVESQPYAEAEEDGAEPTYDEEYGDEFDETFIEQEPGHGRIIGALRGAGRSPWTKVAAALLVSLGAAGATVATMRPDWVGLVPAAVTPERVDVARPQIAVTPTVEQPIAPVPVPSVAAADSPTTVPSAPSDDSSSVQPELMAAVETELEPSGVPSVPLVETQPISSTPVVVPSEPDVEEPAGARPRPSLAFVGFETRDGMEILDLDETLPPRASGVQSVSPGERAFAQLRNAEIFVGVVKVVEASFVTLDLEPGEVSLSRASLTTLTPLASTDATEMLAAQHGYVRLPTEARLWGQILRNSTNEDVILQTEDARIRVPRGSIVQLQGADPARTALVESQDDSWLDARIREQIKTSGGDAASSATRRR